jgi:hypothetical protein
MDVVVSDVCGPMHVESIGRKKYFVTFIDMSSGHCMVYFIRYKSEATQKAIEYIEYMKRQIGKAPKVLRTDRGLEYNNERMHRYLRKNGIKAEYTVGYAPEQNGMAERKNRTLVEACRTMITESGMSQRLWAEAIHTANDTFNRMIDKDLGVSPYEACFGKESKEKQFYQFGAEAYIKVPDEHRRKLEVKAIKVKFIGYSDESKGYRFIDGRNKVHISREVVFLETEKKNEENDSMEFSPNDLSQEDRTPSDKQLEEVKQLEDEKLENEKLEDEQLENEQLEDEDTSEGELFYDCSNEEPQQQELPRRSARENIGKRPSRFDDYELNYVAMASEFEPKTYEEAIECQNSSRWIKAMTEEIAAIEENDTWELVDLPRGRKAIGSKWVFKIKTGSATNSNEFKARLVAQGFSQKFGVDYDEVFAPVARSATMRLLLSVAGIRNLVVMQYDIKSAFLNGKLEEEIYIKQPLGFEKGTQVYKLKKSLYGLKQAAYVWNQTLHKSLVENGCTQGKVDKCLYVKREGDKECYILIHVDDIIIASTDETFQKQLMEEVGKNFKIKCLGNISYYLGIEVSKDGSDYYISQASYIDKIINESNLTEAKSSSYPVDKGYYKLNGRELESNEQYRKLIGMLLYLSTNTRPDISASVSILSQRVKNPRQCDLVELNRVIRYLKGTKNLKLRLSDKANEGSLKVYSDADWAEDTNDRKSNSGYISFVNGGTISWSSHKQGVVAKSSMESEYIALAEACQEAVWLKQVADDFCVGGINEAVNINTDSQSCMAAIKNQRYSNRTKHIDVQYHYTRDLVEKGRIKLSYCPTDKNTADILTKPLGGTKIAQLRGMTGLMEVNRSDREPVLTMTTSGGESHRVKD